VLGVAIMLYALAAYPVIGTLTGHAFPAAPVFGVAPCPSVIFTAGLLLWSRPRLPAYVIVVPLFWLLAQSPAEAIALTVYGDLARPVVGVVATGLLIWRDYRGVGERLFGGALLLVAVVCLGHDDLLMALALVFLGVTFVRRFVQRPGPVSATWTLTSSRK
jgi:hypothetical protein